MNDAGNSIERWKDDEWQGQMTDQPAAERSGIEEERGGAVASGTTTGAWTTAALTHASVVVTLILALAGGVGAFVGLVLPLVIYLSHRERSRFVVFHALQALVYQGAGVVIYLVLAVVLALAVTIAWTVSGLLSAVVIGLLLMPLALLLTTLMVVVLLGAPLAWVAYGLYAAYQVYQGNNFHYWLVGEWIEREM